MELNLDADELSSCVACGLCLPHCPTFRVTGEEALSPRGRIAAMRAVQWDGLTPEDDFIRSVDTCIQCRGCETACPSGVPFGHLMEGTRSALAGAGRITPWWQRAGFAVLGHHRLLLAGSTALAAAQRLRIVPRRLGLARVPVRRGPRLRTTGTDVWLFTGCVMDAWQRPVHRAVAEVLDALRVGAMVPLRGGDCCGALHVHAGLDEPARRLAERVMSSMPGDAPILVDSAGCGAALKEYGHLIGTPEAATFSRRVQDVHEFVAPRVGELRVRTRQEPVIVQDPCHLRHVQRVHGSVRTVLAAVGPVVELDDDSLCCGAGGAYSALHPDLASAVRDRKLAAIQRAQVAAARLGRASSAAGPAVVASANPGCAMHLGAAGVRVSHPMEVLAEAIR